jgi:hypothetical protein
MTKKDYTALASALSYAGHACASEEQKIGWNLCCEAIISALVADNLRFDSARFREACER